MILNQVILSPDVIWYHPDWSKLFQVEMDASRFGIGAGIGAVLAQESNCSIRTVRFASCAFNNTESRSRGYYASRTVHSQMEAGTI